MGFPRQEHWSDLPFLLHGNSQTQGLNPCLLIGRQILYHRATWEACVICISLDIFVILVQTCTYTCVCVCIYSISPLDISAWSLLQVATWSLQLFWVVLPTTSWIYLRNFTVDMSKCKLRFSIQCHAILDRKNSEPLSLIYYPLLPFIYKLSPTTT